MSNKNNLETVMLKKGCWQSRHR